MKNIPVKIHLIDPSLPLPAYHSQKAAGFDFYSRLDIQIPPQQVVLVPTNLILEIPANFWLLVAARSSLHKLGLQLINGVGVIDPDYCGPSDEIRLLLYNYTTQPVTIRQGERLAQGILQPRFQAQFQPVAQMSCPNRGGIGSTGK